VRGKSLIDVQVFSQSILNSLWSFGTEAGFNFCPNKTFCLPMNYNSKNIRLTFGSSVLKVVWECKYLGFRFAVKPHDDFGGLSVEPQKKYELTELRRRVNWLPLLSAGKGGANFSVMRQMYISLVRSKISFCFLLKDYVDDLEKIQNRAMRLILSAMPGCPIGAMSNLLDLPDLRSLQKHHAFQVYCQLLDANIPELENSYMIASEEKYHHSPLGWISYVHWFISSFENPDVPQMDYVQRLSRHNEFVFGATAFQIEPPTTKPSRTLWVPPPIIEDEHCFYSDGAYLDGSFTGAGAALNMKSGCLRSYSFYPCTSSSEAEKEGLFMATDLALEADLRNSTIVFILDSASVLLGIKNWIFKQMLESEIRIMANLQALMAKGNRVKFRFVPSHLDRDDYWKEHNEVFFHQDVRGNSMVDSECTRALDSARFFPPLVIRAHHSKFIKAIGREFRTNRCRFNPSIHGDFFKTEIKPSLNFSLRKKLRRTSRHCAVTISRLMCDHYALQGYFHRLRLKKAKLTNPFDVVVLQEHLCRFCESSPETTEHLLTECSDATVIQAREESREELNLVIPQPLSGSLTRHSIYVANLLDDSQWKAVHSFFSKLNLSV
jgi:hypothetical protein